MARNHLLFANSSKRYCVAEKAERTFIIDCPVCRAKVAAVESGSASRSYYDDDAGEPFSERVQLGKCPICKHILVGHSEQIEFAEVNSDYDRWSDVVRVYPLPPKSFSSIRIPSVVKESLVEADKSLQAGANRAGCVMLGRTLEGLCQDLLKKKVMLAEGIKQLKAKNLIDDRLYDWSQQLRAFRNLSAHPDESVITRQDAEDLHAFVNAMIEYVYDLSDRYDEFKSRADAAKKKQAPT
jgi:hypothetical protein